MESILQAEAGDGKAEADSGKQADTSTALVPASTLPDLAERINAEHHQAEALLHDSLQHALQAGRLLREVKARLDHGEWLPWLKNNFDGSTRTAQVYMGLQTKLLKLGAKKRNAVALLSLRQVIASTSRKRISPLIKQEASKIIDVPSNDISAGADSEIRVAQEQINSAAELEQNIAAAPQQNIVTAPQQNIVTAPGETANATVGGRLVVNAGMFCKPAADDQDEVAAVADLGVASTTSEESKPSTKAATNPCRCLLPLVQDFGRLLDTQSEPLTEAGIEALFGLVNKLQIKAYATRHLRKHLGYDRVWNFLCDLHAALDRGHQEPLASIKRHYEYIRDEVQNASPAVVDTPPPTVVTEELEHDELRDFDSNMVLMVKCCRAMMREWPKEYRWQLADELTRLVAELRR